MVESKKTFWIKYRRWIIITASAIVLYLLRDFISERFIKPNKESPSLTQIQQENKNIGDVNNIEQQIINNYSFKDSGNAKSSKYKIYLLRLMPITLNKDKHLYEYIFGNPDNSPVADVAFGLESNKGFDTAYFERPFSINNGVFEKSIIRDAYCTLSPDKKRIIFTASFIGESTTIKIVTATHENGNIRLLGVGKLW